MVLSQDKNQWAQNGIQEVMSDHQEGFEPCYRLPRGSKVCLENYRSFVDVVLGTLLFMSLLVQGMEQMDPGVPSAFSFATLPAYSDTS